MQAFEFAKQLLIDLRHEKIARLNAGGDVRADTAAPIYLMTRIMDIDYGKEYPLREVGIKVRFGEGETGTVKKYTLEVPDNVSLTDGRDIHLWVTSVFKFVASCQNASIAKAEQVDSRNTEDTTGTRVFFSAGQWTLYWETMEGLLSRIPMELAGQQMDMQEKFMLDRWRDSAVDWNADPDDRQVCVEKYFQDAKQAATVRELLHQILVINGYRDNELKANIQLSQEDDEIVKIKMPLEYLQRAEAAERYMGL